MKITVHPLFLAVGLASALFGGLPVFLVCVVTALLHECGHVFCAEKMGFECTKISLMPFGAAATCNLIFYANGAMLAINLLPAYPLDGGRVARCALLKFMPARAVGITLRVINVVAVVALVLVFIFAYRNFSLLFVGAFLLCSAFEKAPPARKINFAARKKKRGREIRYVILDENATFRDALKFVDSSRYLVLQIYGDKFLDEICEDELYERLLKSNIYDKIL